MTFAEAFAALRRAAAERGHGGSGVHLRVEVWAWPDGSVTAEWCTYIAATGHAYRGETADDAIAKYCAAHAAIPQAEVIESIGEVPS